MIHFSFCEFDAKRKLIWDGINVDKFFHNEIHCITCYFRHLNKREYW